MIEHEHGPIAENLFSKDSRPIKCVHPDTIIMVNNTPFKIKSLIRMDNSKELYKTITKNGIYRPISKVYHKYSTNS